MTQVIAIIGPTAVGKSAAAMRIAGSLDVEIVSVDSRQIYRHLDIGTSKPTAEERKRVRHHMIDLLELKEKSNASWFAVEARSAIADIASRGKVPLLVGGSGLYLRSLLEGLFEIDLEPGARAEFARSIEGVETGELYERLLSADRQSAERIHPNDRYRISRALEVYKLTGSPLSEHFRRQKENGSGPSFDTVKLGLNMQRRKLHERIDSRTVRMVDEGWPEEVQRLLDGGADPRWYGMRTLGYPEMIDHVSGRSSLDEAVTLISARTRQYAKSQLTWFRKEKDVTWVDPQTIDPLEAVAKLLDINGIT